MNNGRYGEYGGQYISETLMNELLYLEEQYHHYMNDPDFVEELNTLLKEYAGRPSLLYYAKRMTEDLGGAKIYLKREDLNHTGAHKINNVLGQVLLAKKMGDFGKIIDKKKFRNEGDKIYAFKPQPDRYLCFFKTGKKIIVTNAFRKKGDKLPEQEKTLAINNMANYYLSHKDSMEE